MGKNNSWLVITNIILILIVIAASVYHFTERTKIAYVDLTKVYNEFDLKKELEKKADEVQQKRKTILDSLEFNLKMLSRELSDAKEKDKVKMTQFEFQRENYFEKKQQFEEDNDLMIKKYDEQIYKQLNQYVKDYGEREKYSIVYGANGTGSLMYAQEKFDISKEIISYINKKYKGIE